MLVPRFLLILVALAGLATPISAAPRKLPALGADQTRTSVSGLSSGGFMAVQFSVAYSASTIGAGIVAGGPYGCGLGGLAAAYPCMNGHPTGAGAYSVALWYAAWTAIDPVERIARQKIYLFHGANDAIVGLPTMDAVRDFYVDAHLPAANLLYRHDLPAGHAFISDDLGGACEANGGHFINRCDVDGMPYDQPREILGHIYGSLQEKVATLSSRPFAFDQRPFLPPLSGMADTGYAFVPASCRKAGAHCAVHVVFHGCGQSAKYVGDDVYGKVGYNEWADGNGIILVYPQVDRSDTLPFNPQGCWDWWGYSGPFFATKSGSQLYAVRSMVEQLSMAPQ